MLTEVGVGDVAHGVAEVEFADVDVAVDGAEEVDAEGTLVLADEVFCQPGFDVFFLFGRVIFSSDDRVRDLAASPGE